MSPVRIAQHQIQLDICADTLARIERMQREGRSCRRSIEFLHAILVDLLAELEAEAA